MKKILAIIMAVVMTLAVCALTGCGDKKDDGSTTPTSKVEATEKETAENVDPKQAAYEEMFNDLTKIELNSKDASATMTANGKKVMEMQSKESGEAKMTMYLSDTLGYTTYTIGDYDYVEMHIPEYKDDKGKTVKAEDVYYKTKTTGSTTAETFDISNVIDTLQLSKENIKSIKYVETKDVNGVSCDVVEVVHTMTSSSGTVITEEESLADDIEAAAEDVAEAVDSAASAITDEKKTEDAEKEAKDAEEAAEDSENGSDADSVDTIGAIDGSDGTAEATDVTTTFYFTADGNKLFGFKSDTDGATTECYFPTDLVIEVPKDVKFVDADEETISSKLMSLYTAIYSQADTVGENEAEDSLSN